MGFGLHSRPIPNTPRRIAKCRFKSRIANLFMKLRSIVLEMIIFRLQPFKTLRGVIMHHQNCVVLNNSQVLVREAPPPSENGIEFKVAKSPSDTTAAFFIGVFAFSNFKDIFLGLSDGDCKVYTGSASGALPAFLGFSGGDTKVYAGSASGALRVLPKVTRIKQQKSSTNGRDQKSSKGDRIASYNHFQCVLCGCSLGSVVIPKSVLDIRERCESRLLDKRERCESRSLRSCHVSNQNHLRQWITTQRKLNKWLQTFSNLPAKQTW